VIGFFDKIVHIEPILIQLDLELMSSNTPTTWGNTRQIKGKETMKK